MNLSPLEMEGISLGPFYFFDQPPCRQHGTREKKTAVRLPLDLRCGGINSYFATNIMSKCEKSLSVDESADNDKDDNIKSEDEVKQKEKQDALLTTINEPVEVGNYEKCPIAAPNGSLRGEETDINTVNEYKIAAPPLLHELGQLLARCEACEKGGFHHGLINVLNNNIWNELTMGVVQVKQPERFVSHKIMTRRPKSPVTSGELVGAGSQVKRLCAKKKVKNKDTMEESGNEKITQEFPKRTAASSHKSHLSQMSTTISFSISSKSCKEQGWIIQPEDPPLDDHQWNTLSQRVMEGLQLPGMQIEKQDAQLAKQGYTKPLLRHYGDTKKDAAVKLSKPDSKALCFGILPVPEMRQGDCSLQKLHYRINDGTSFIYYPSGRVAVCQSHSGLPCGGFYTNVFGDTPTMPIFATFTAFGHGSIIHPFSGTVTTAWDQHGGVKCDLDGTVTKEWTWPAGTRLNEPIVIQVTEQITLRVRSSTSACLWFRSLQDTVRLPITSLSNMAPSKEQTEEQFSLSATSDLFKPNRQNIQKMNTRKNFKARKSMATASSCEALEVARGEERLDDALVFWRKGQMGIDLKRLRCKVRNIVDSWLEYYRIATGIGCLDIHRLSGSPRRFPLKRQVQSATLPSLVGSEAFYSNQSEEGAIGTHTNTRDVSALAGSVQQGSPSYSRPSQLTCTLWKLGKEEQQHVTKTGAVRVHSNIRLEPVVIPRSPEICHLGAYTLSLASPCPVVLRAALLGQKEQRLCRCSVRQAPLLTDLEYDAFVRNQGARSEQILVVCVTSSQCSSAASTEETLEDLYERRNRNRSTPCTQCHMDPFRLVKYGVPNAGIHSATHSALLKQRHNVAPGMFLMYLRGQLLFADYIFNGYNCSVKDLQKQIAKTRGDYRRGQCLPPDFRFSPQMDRPEVTGCSPATEELKD